MITKFNIFESVRDKMTPISKDKLKSTLDTLSVPDKFKMTSDMGLKLKEIYGKDEIKKMLMEFKKEIKKIGFDYSPFNDILEKSMDMYDVIDAKKIGYGLFEFSFLKYDFLFKVVAEMKPHQPKEDWMIDVIVSHREYSILCFEDLKRIVDKFQKVQESIRDLMTPMSRDKFKMGKLEPEMLFIEGIKHLVPWMIEKAIEDGVNPKGKWSLGFDGKSQSYTPLEYACWKGDEIVVKLLLKYGVEVTEKAIEQAEFMGHRHIVKILQGY